MWNLFAGYVIIEFIGASAERVINSIAAKRFDIWNIKRMDSTRIRAYMSLRTYVVMRKLLRNCGGRCHVKLIKKGGILFKLSALRERKLFLYGWAIVLVSLLVLSGSLWRIKITGCDEVKSTAIMRYLEANGVSLGMRTAKLNTMSLASGLCACEARIAFTSVQLKGVTLYVDIKETDESFLQPERNSLSSLFAKKDGIVRLITVKNGRPLVNLGDAVKLGDELVSGVMAEGLAPVNTEAEVLAEVLYRCEASAGPTMEVVQRTGASYESATVYISDLALLSAPGVYKLEKRENELTVELKGFFLPIRVEKNRVYELTKKLGSATEIELTEAAISAANKKLLSSLPKDAKLLSKQTIIRHEGEIIIAQIVATTLEDIAING